MKKEDFLKVCRAKAKAALTPQEEEFLGGIGEAVEQAFQADSIERNKALKQAVEGLESKIGTFDEGQNPASVIRALATKIDSLEALQNRKLGASDAFKLRRALEAKKDEILKVIRKEQTTPWGLEFKAIRAASAMMTTSTLVTGAAAINTDNLFDDVELTVIRYPQNFILDTISSRQVGKVPFAIKWKEEGTAGDGDAAVVAEGDTKPLIDKTFAWKYGYRKKYAGRIEYTEETEIDFEQLVLDVIAMFEEQVLRKYNDGVLADILAWAPSYAGTALDLTIVKPTLMNVVSAGQLQLASANYKGDVLIINPADYASTQNMQNKEGDPIFIPDNVLFPGLRLFVTNKIAAGTALLGEGNIVKEQHGAFILRSGVYGNQLIENEKTIIGEIFSVLKLPTESKKGWVKMDVEAVKTALLKQVA